MMKRAAAVGLVLAGVLAGFAGCGNSNGTCEYKFEEGSKDGSIPAGQEVCAPDWVAESCNLGQMRAMTVNLKTSGYTFTKGAKCEERGYKSCDAGGRAILYYKTCPGK